MDTHFQADHFNESVHQYKPELLAHPPRYVREELALILGSIPPHAKKILDFGCGTGRLSIPLLKKGYKVYGVDISVGSLKQVIANIRALIPSFQSRFNSSTRFPEGKWDVVMGTDVLHHVDLAVELPKMRKVLVPGGTLIFSEPNAWNIAWYIFLGIMNSWKAEKGLMHCSVNNFRKELAAHGFHDIRFLQYGIVPPILLDFFPPLQALNYAVARLPFFRLFAYRIIVIARS